MPEQAKTSGAKRLVPRLRFPEFRHRDAWKVKPLGDVAGFFKGKGLSKSEMTPDGKTACIHYGELFTAYGEVIERVRGRTNLSGDVSLSIANDVLMPTSDVTPRGLAKASCIRLDGVILSGDTLIVRPHSHNTSGEFLARYIRHREPAVLRLVSGSTVFHLYPAAISKLQLAYPEHEEQQKIADCLSSVDDLITAHADKLAVLKQHKQGLLEQLFPREGETVPRLRFPEFRKAVAWESKKLVNVAHVVRGGSPRPIADYQTDDEDGLAWLKIGDVSEDAKYITKTSERIKRSGLSKTREIHSGDLILSNSMSFGRPYLSQVSACIHDGWLAITDLPQHVSSEFMYYLLSAGNCQRYFADAAAGSGVHNLNIDIVEVAPIMVPEEREQIRVADCLSGLDTLITAQADRLAALKQHKQGLLQQLFPIMDEAAT